MTNKEYFSSNDKTVKEMMSDFSSSGFDSFDKWLDCKRNMFSNDITFITCDGKEITSDEPMLGDDNLKYVCIKNSVLEKNDACFCVRLNDLDGGAANLRCVKWSDSQELSRVVPSVGDCVVSGRDVTFHVRSNHRSEEFPAFFVSEESDGGTPFLPSVFQLNYLWKYKDDISTVMCRHGYGNPFGFEGAYLWSSTQDTNAFALIWNSDCCHVGSYLKTSKCYVLPFFAI